MKWTLPVIGCCVVLAGCTSHALKRSTVAVSASVPAIIEGEYLDNLGRFLDDPFAIPAVLELHGGQVRVSSQLSPTYKWPYHFADPTKSSREVDLGAQMTWDEQWTVVPVTDEDDLGKLQKFFRGIIQNQAQRSGHCDWNDPAKWLCVDPKDKPAGGANDEWTNKGHHHGYSIWARRQQYATSVLTFLSTPTKTLGQKQNQILLSVPLQ